MKAESNLGGLLGKSSRLLANIFNAKLVGLGLTVEQWSLLAVLWSEDSQSQKSLQEALLKDKATINSLVKYLLDGGFILKVQDEKDRRSFIISLSDKGRAIQGESIPFAIESIGLATEGISKEALATTTQVLQEIIINLTKDKT